MDHASHILKTDEEKKVDYKMTDSSSDGASSTLGANGRKKARGECIRTILFVLAVGIINLNTWGLILTFGVFQEYLHSAYLSVYSNSSIAWVGTVSGFLMLTGGVLTGPAYDWGYARHLIVFGSVMIVIGQAMFSLSRTYYQVFLSQGICVGIGSGLVYIPSLTAVAQSFDRARSRAIGLASCGASVGGILYPVLFRSLQSSVGFPWAIRSMTLVVLVTQLVALAILIPRVPNEKRPARRLVDSKAFTDGPFMVFCLAGGIVLLGFYIPYVYLPAVGLQVGASTDMAFYLIAITNAGGIVGRSLPTWLADKIGAMYMLCIATLCSAVLLFCWPAVQSSAGITVWSVFWGVVSGLVVALPGSIIPSLIPDPALLGTRMGMAWACFAVGLLIGGPIGGALIEARPGTAWPMEIFAGSIMVLGTTLGLIPAMHLYRRNRTTQTNSN